MKTHVPKHHRHLVTRRGQEFLNGGEPAKCLHECSRIDGIRIIAVGLETAFKRP
jgi:hypothetical protein